MEFQARDSEAPCWSLSSPIKTHLWCFLLFTFSVKNSGLFASCNSLSCQITILKRFCRFHFGYSASALICLVFISQFTSPFTSSHSFKHYHNMEQSCHFILSFLLLFCSLRVSAKQATYFFLLFPLLLCPRPLSKSQQCAISQNKICTNVAFIHNFTK